MQKKKIWSLIFFSILVNIIYCYNNILLNHHLVFTLETEQASVCLVFQTLLEEPSLFKFNFFLSLQSKNSSHQEKK